jgi:transposase
LKNWRRIATRYDRHAQNYLSGLALAAIVCQLDLNESPT